jgi:hypothetical protein
MALSHYSRYRKWVVSLQVSGPPGLVEHVCGDKEDGDSQGEVIIISMYSVLYPL